MTAVKKQVSVTVRGDDFTSTGTEANLRWFEEGFVKECEFWAHIADISMCALSHSFSFVSEAQILTLL